MFSSVKAFYITVKHIAINNKPKAHLVNPSNQLVDSPGSIHSANRTTKTTKKSFILTPFINVLQVETLAHCETVSNLFFLNNRFSEIIEII